MPVTALGHSIVVVINTVVGFCCFAISFFPLLCELVAVGLVAPGLGRLILKPLDRVTVAARPLFQLFSSLVTFILWGLKFRVTFTTLDSV